MPNRRDIRRLAMQVLYQIDLRGQEDLQAVRESLEDDTFNNPKVIAAAFKLASDAWQQHQQADQMVTQLAPNWPTSRQPPVDRAILRLAYHELVTQHAPARVVINEAVELAKHYGAEQSPSFINGVLDKAAQQIQPADLARPSPPETDKPPSAGQWLDDALDDGPA